MVSLKAISIMLGYDHVKSNNLDYSFLILARRDRVGSQLGLRGEDLGSGHFHRQRQEELLAQDHRPQ